MSDIREALPAHDRTRESALRAGEADASTNMFEEARRYLENASAIRAQYTPRVPDGFPGADQLLPIPARIEGIVQTIPASEIGRTRSSERLHGQTTEVRAPGAGARTTVRFDVDGEGNQTIRDHLGNWTSRDGGETWTTGEPNYRIRRGPARIDEQGNYTFENRDFGSTTTMTRDARTIISMRAATGESFSLTRNSAGDTVSFTTPAGEWTRNGNVWRNGTTGDVRHGDVALTDFGQFSFAGTENGRLISELRRTEQMLRAEDLRDEIEHTYGVRIERPGTERVDYRRTNVAGMPTEEELRTLRSVLERTSHEVYTNMRIWFIRPDEMRPGDAQAHYGHYSRDPVGGQHRCSGCSAGHVRSTQGNMVIMPMARQSTNEWQGLEGLLLHELMHHEQGQRFGHSNNAWGRPGDSPVVHDIARQAGWEFSARHGRSLLRDREGGLWRYVEAASEWRWSGGLQPRDGRRRLDSQQMRERAMVRPATPYNSEPDEGLAEGGAMFRMAVRAIRPYGADTHRDRQYLAEESPAVYRLVRSLDQDSIDRSPRYAADENGYSRFVRDLRGRIVPRSEAVVREIETAERIWAATASENELRRTAEDDLRTISSRRRAR